MTTKPTPAERKADRALCPVTISSKLDLRVRDVAEAMRAAGETKQLTMDNVKTWRRDPDSQPEWLSRLLDERDARRASRRARKDAREAAKELAYEKEYAEREARVIEKLGQGKTVFRHPMDEEIIADLALRVLKGMGPEESSADLDLTSRSVLRAAGVRV